MLNELIQQILENALYQNGQQPDIVLEQGFIVDDITCVDEPKIKPGSTTEISGTCEIYVNDHNYPDIKTKYQIEIEANNDITVSYSDYDPEL